MKLSKEWFAEVIPDLYSGGISYHDAIKYLSQFETLSRENKLWCKEIWCDCENRKANKRLNGKYH